MANRDLALLTVQPINLGGSDALANLAGTSATIRPSYTAGYATAAAYTSPSDASYIRQPPVSYNNSGSYNGSNPAASTPQGGLTTNQSSVVYDPFNNGFLGSPTGDGGFFDPPDDGGFFNPIPGGLGGTGGGANGGYNGTGNNGGGVVPVGAIDDAKTKLGSIYDFIDGFFFGGLLPGGVDFRSVLTAMIGVLLLGLGVYALIK